MVDDVADAQLAVFFFEVRHGVDHLGAELGARARQRGLRKDVCIATADADAGEDAIVVAGSLGRFVGLGRRSVGGGAGEGGAGGRDRGGRGGRRERALFVVLSQVDDRLGGRALALEKGHDDEGGEGVGFRVSARSV